MNRKELLTSAAAASVAGLFAGCASHAADVSTDAGVSPQKPTDVVEIVETQWEVRPGLSVALRTYGGVVPGKILRYKSGQHANIRVVNRTSETQTVHWHGLIVPDTVDGVPELGTPVVRPGESHDYAFVVRPSGTRW